MRLALLGVLVLFVMLPAASLSAADYYFSTAGNDGSGDGTISKPWASLSKLNGLNLGPGDRVYLRGGDSFSGSVVIAAADAGTAANPVRFASYGTGRAVISPGADQNGFDIYNAAGVEIRQLEVDGGDLSTHNKNGIGLYNDLAGNTRLEHVVISDCVVRNCHAGITVGAWASDNSYSGFADVTIERTLVRDCEDNGIVSWGMSSSSATSQSHRNITVRDCEVTGVTGDPDKTDGHSGSGIIMAGTIGGLVEGCYAHHNGGGGGRPTGGGPVGIWAWGAADVTIRRSLVHDQKTINGAVDGGGFDLDGGAVNCVIEYCYSYDNQGPGFLVAEFVGAAPLRDNAIRYNVSFNDGRANGMGGIHFWNGKSDASLCENIDFYGNLIVAGPNTTGPVVDYQSGGMRNIRFFNNIFVSQRGLDLVKSSNTSAFTFQGNAWHAIDGNHDYVWGGTTYDSLAAWRTAAGTPETRSGAALGIQADPGMVDLASMPKPTSVAQLDALTAFRLADASPCIDAGQDLSTLAISDDGGQDFFGASLPLGAALDIGPHERAPAVVVVDPPSVSISAPSGGSSHEAGAGVGLAATASSAGSTVSSVRFTITPSAGGSAVFDRTDTSSAGGWTASWVAGTPGNYRIDATATDADGRSTAASSASITVVDTTAPSVPGQPVASQVGAAGCQLDWAASSDVVGVTAYRILRDGSQIGTSTGTSFTVTGLQLDTSYAFSVRAVDAAGNVSAASSSATVVTVADPPTVSISAPSGGSSHEAGATVSLAATASSAESTVSSVRFTITPSAGGSAVLDQTDTSSAGGWAASWVASTPGNYRIDATATDAGGRSTAASSTSITVVDTTAPSAPGLPVASQVSFSGCQLDWAASSDVVGVTTYRILRDGSQIGTSAGTSFTVTGLQAETSYAFSVRAVDAAGNVSAASSTATVVTLADSAGIDPPTVSISAPSGGSSHEAGATVSLAATVSSAESTVSSVRFTITPSAGGSAVLDYTDTSSAGGWTASWVASTPGNYRIDATATDAGGRSTAASSKTITVVDTTAPSVPGQPVASQVGATGCQLDWAVSSDVVGVTTYRILRDGSQIGTSAGTSFTVIGLQAETSYAFSVRAADAAGNVSAASSAVTVVTLAVPVTRRLTVETVPGYGWLLDGALPSETSASPAVFADQDPSAELTLEAQVLSGN